MNNNCYFSTYTINISASAPAIAEHVAEALLPQYSGGFDGAPSRFNPRMPKSSGHPGGDMTSGFGPNEYFEENPDFGILDDGRTRQNGLLGSLLVDSKPKTPMDLIQVFQIYF